MKIFNLDLFFFRKKQRRKGLTDSKKIHHNIRSFRIGKRSSPARYLGRSVVLGFSSFGKSYHRREKWLTVIGWIGRYMRIFSRWVGSALYRAFLVATIIAVVYSVTPGALSAPQSMTISTRLEWEAGTLTDTTTEGATDAIQLVPEGTWTARVWAPSPDTIGQGESSIMVGNSLYVMRGYSDKAFWKYDTTRNEWSELSDLPFPAYYGADMVYDGGTHVYVLFGGYSKEFWKYDTATNVWTELPDVLDSIWTGASIGFDGTDVYVVRGTNNSEFWKFDVSENSWLNLTPTPSTVNTGSNIVYGQNGYFYLTRGSNSLTYYRYDISGNTWSSMANAPSGYNFNGDQKGIYVGGYIYYLRSGNTNDFSRYNIAGNSWDTLEDTPLNANYASLSYNSTDGLIYALRGNGTYDLWKYDPSVGASGAWVGPKQVLDGSGTIGTGGDLFWNGQTGAGAYVYALRGNNTTAFYRYDMAANDWVSRASAPANMGSDSTGTFYNGNIYVLRGSNTATFYSYNESGDSWSTLTDLPATANHGAGVAYNASDGLIYALRGNGTSNFYAYTIGGGWASLPDISVGGVTYSSYLGGRIVSDGTDIYVTVGDGETALLKYDTTLGSWSRVSSTPFAQYYGTDIAYANGKIYALAGYYKDETWEYDISGNSWRRLPNNQKYIDGRGPYNGASLTYAGNNTFYALTGQGLSDMWSFSAGATNYLLSGTYTSETLDLANVSGWVSFSATDDTPTNTTIIYESRTSSDGDSWSSWDTISGGTIASSEARYMQIRITLSTSDGVSTPTVSDYTISYNSEDVEPTNPSSINASSQQVGGTTLTSGETYAYEHPYFSWSGAVDSGSGVDGYYVYFGTDSGADPETDGSYQTETTYSVNAALQTGTYYLRIRTKDANGNISTATWSAFTYGYDGVSPPLSEARTGSAEFDLGTLDNVTSSSVADSLRLSSVSGFWKETQLSNAPASIYRGGELTHISYDGGNYAFTFRGNNNTAFYRYDIDTDTWTSMANAPETVNYGGYTIAGPTGFLYGSRGNNTSTFWKYDIAGDSWSSVASAPKNFTYGSSLSFDGSRYIYAIPGNDDAFYRYDTQNNIWTTLPNINFGNPNTVDGQRTYIGSDSNYDGRNNIYVTQGNYYPYFAKYSIDNDVEHGETANTWTILTPSPIGMAEGGSITYDSSTDSIYAVRGNWRKNFFRYDVSSDTWFDLSDVPAVFAYGASLSYYNGYIYATRGANSTAFYRFNIDESSWETPNRGFFGPSTSTGSSYFQYYYGSFMAGDGDDTLYIIRGYYDNTFGKYTVSTGEFTELSKLPVGAYNGANLVYNEDEGMIYYTPGAIRTTRSGLNNYFFKYDISENTWEEITTDIPPTQTNYGSTMAYDGSRYIYLTRGANSSTWWRYDTQASAGSRWSGTLATISGWTQGYGGRILFKDNYIYSLRGQNTNTFYRYDTGGDSWVQLSDVPGNIYIGGDLIDGRDGYLYASRGNNTNEFYRYSIGSDTWDTISSVPAQVYQGGTGGYVSNRIWTTSGTGANGYRDGIYSYVVGSEANGTGFEKTGTYTSESIDLLSVYEWANLTVTFDQPDNTFLSIETRTSDDETDWSSWTPVSNEHEYSNVHEYAIASETKRYIQVKFSFTSSDHIFSPKVDDFTIHYYQDITAPTNPSSISAYSDSGAGTPIVSGEWGKYTAPYFVWPAEGDAGGAADNVGGSGIAGYYVYYGTDSNANPFVSGAFQTETTYTASGMISGETSYLKIMAIDNAGMIPVDSYSAFTYSFDSTAPTNPSDISVIPAGYTAADSYEFVWLADATDLHSGLDKFQYQTGEDDANTWYDIADTGTVSITLPNVDHITGAYQSGKNWFYLRAVDAAGNVSAALSQEYYYSASAPSPPQNLTVTPEVSTTNAFTFQWARPSSFIGDGAKLLYYYSINTLPNAFNVVETAVLSAGPGPFATQKGSNRFYVVAKDEAGNIDYDLYAYVDFSANTVAPGAPLNVQIFDTSDRENEEYSVALKWSPPSSYSEDDFAGYVIYRSDDDSTYEQVATTSGSAYVDTGLESRLYYYYVKARDNTNNLSIPSSTVSIIPTGRYTTPPVLVGNPKVVSRSFSADFSWATNRVASSFVEYGKTIELGKTNGQIDSVTDHIVLLNGLSAGTKYFYRVKYIDQDGNIGTSDIDYFSTLPPPTISDFLVSDIGLDSAIVSWKTNTSATCTLTYNGAAGLSNVVEELSGGSSHIEKIEGLAAETAYRASVTCVDGDLNEFDSDEYTFSTPVRPVASEVKVENRENVDIPTVMVEYLTNVPTTTLIYFKHADESQPHTFLQNEKTTEHSAVIEGLDPAKEYTLTIGGTDDNGIDIDPIEQKITTRSDSRPPEILVNRAVGKVIGRGSNAQSNIYVKVETNEPTRVVISYAQGVVSSTFEQSTPEDPSNTYHLITIPAETGNVYSYQVAAYDDADNLTKTSTVTVVVEQARASATEVISDTVASRFGWIMRLYGGN